MRGHEKKRLVSMLMYKNMARLVMREHVQTRLVSMVKPLTIRYKKTARRLGWWIAALENKEPRSPPIEQHAVRMPTLPGQARKRRSPIALGVSMSTAARNIVASALLGNQVAGARDSVPVVLVEYAEARDSVPVVLVEYAEARDSAAVALVEIQLAGPRKLKFVLVGNQLAGARSTMVSVL